MSGARYPQFCALARAAEIVGERWTLLIVRDLLLGAKRFGDLSERLNGITPAVLTARLNNLIELGLVRRAVLPPPANIPVYELTEIGRGLRPAMRELIRWGGFFLFPMRPDDHFEPDWVLLALDAIALKSPSPARKLALRVTHGGKTGTFLAEGGEGGTRISQSDGPSEALIEAPFDVLLQIIAAKLPIERAVKNRRAKIEGSIRAARQLPQMFDLRGRTA